MFGQAPACSRGAGTSPQPAHPVTLSTVSFQETANFMNRSLPSIALVFVICSSAAAQPAGYNYDEAKVPEFTLPDPLVLKSGEPVTTPEQWVQERRPEVLGLFEQFVYGRAPREMPPMTFRVVSEDAPALDGRAIRREVDVVLGEEPNTRTIRILIYRPQTDAPVPAFLTLNFYGNHTISDDPAISLNPNWMRNNADKGVVENRATEDSRGTSASRWPVEKIVSAGYALATIYYGDIDPDFDDGFENGVHALFPNEESTERAGDAWGSIATWAWGLSRALDYFETDSTIDADRVAVMGHSRLGKTSLWAGAADERFALVISNDSGCGGAALSRRRFGETVERINTSFPHWFCRNFRIYNGREDELPVDQHMLVSLIAPRPVYIASAVDDVWADPRGEYLSGYYADPVYRLLGTDGLGGDKANPDPPAVDMPRDSGTIGYHIRTGKHDVTDFDWDQYIKFADRHLKSTSSSAAE